MNNKAGRDAIEIIFRIIGSAVFVVWGLIFHLMLSIDALNPEWSREAKLQSPLGQEAPAWYAYAIVGLAMTTCYLIAQRIASGRKLSRIILAMYLLIVSLSTLGMAIFNPPPLGAGDMTPWYSYAAYAYTLLFSWAIAFRLLRPPGSKSKARGDSK